MHFWILFNVGAGLLSFFVGLFLMVTTDSVNAFFACLTFSLLFANAALICKTLQQLKDNTAQVNGGFKKILVTLRRMEDLQHLGTNDHKFDHLPEREKPLTEHDIVDMLEN